MDEGLIKGLQELTLSFTQMSKTRDEFLSQKQMPPHHLTSVLENAYQCP